MAEELKQLFSNDKADELIEAITSIDKIDKQQGTANAGKVLTVGDDGLVVPNDLASTDFVLTETIKSSLLRCFRHVMWTDSEGEQYYEELSTALYSGSSNIVSLTVIFEQQGNIIYSDYPLSYLKHFLTVTANYSDGTSNIITDYALEGNLVEGQCTIKVVKGLANSNFIVQVTYRSVLFSIDAPTTFDGTTDIIGTDIPLFSNGDKSYTYMIDFIEQSGDTSKDSVLLSCLGSVDPWPGVELKRAKLASNNVKIQVTSFTLTNIYTVPPSSLLGKRIKVAQSHSIGTNTVSTVMSIDGVIVNMQSSGGYSYSTVSSNLTIGGRYSGSVVNPSSAFKGTINKFALYDIAMSQQELTDFVRGV